MLIWLLTFNKAYAACISFGVRITCVTGQSEDHRLHLSSALTSVLTQGQSR